MRVSDDDERNVHRFLDGELDEAASAGFRARLAAEPGLRERLAEARALRVGFEAGRGRAIAAPAGFTASVVAGVRQLPARAELEQREVAESVIRLCRRLLVAALVVLSFGVAWHVGLLDAHRDTLEAAPAEVRSEMERLVALIDAGLPGVDGRESRSK
jgi:anti-sigma factor RsiW